MAIDMLRAVTALLSTCRRRVSRAARRLGGSHHHLKLLASRSSPLISRVMPFINSGGDRRRKKKIGEERSEELYGDDEDEEVWRRGIIMGEKCQPLDFSGVIYYDPHGRQLEAAPRSPMRSPLAGFLAADGKDWKI